MYNSFIYFNEKLTRINPTLEEYQQLHQQYGTNVVNCPGSQVSITYSSFLDIDCHFHPICSSFFVSDLYIPMLFQIYSKLDPAYATDNALTLQGAVFAYFQGLKALCNMVEDNYNAVRDQYLTSTVIFSSITDEYLFNMQINTSLIQFNSTLANNFLSNLQVIRGMVQSNAFVSLYPTNWYPVINNRHEWSYVYVKPQYYGNCSCQVSSACTQQSSTVIQGYPVGCTPLESILQRSFECWYNQSCIELFISHLNLPSSALQAININETRFKATDTVEKIAEAMFIETCSSHISYSRFFEQCHPLSCTITVTKRKDTIAVIAILFGLYGGLTVALKLMVSALTSFTDKLIRKHKPMQIHQMHSSQ